MKILLGIACIIGGGLYIYNLAIRRSKNNDPWNKVMFFKGYVGGIGLILLGIFLILS